MPRGRFSQIAREREKAAFLLACWGGNLMRVRHVGGYGLACERECVGAACMSAYSSVTSMRVQRQRT